MKYLLTAVIVTCSLQLSARGRAPAGFKAEQLSLCFIENKGQITDQYGRQRKDIDMKLETPGMNIFIGNGEIHYQWFSGSQPGAGGLHPADPSLRYAALRMTNGGMQNTTSPLPPELFAPLMRPLTLSSKGELQERDIKAYRLDVELAGANKNAELVMEGQQAYYENYYLSQCPEGATAHSFNKITYKNIYPGIDWVVYTSNGRLKYDFVVSRGADVSQIRLRYKGAARLELKEGALQAATPMGSITEAAPYSYDAETGAELATAYVLDGNVLHFAVAPHSSSMVIDPYLGWATYYGGSSIDDGDGICTDKAGYLYMIGNTASTTNIVTTGAFQTTLGVPNGNGYLAKFDTAGVRQWATYYGNSGTNSGVNFYSVCSDRNGDIYTAGWGMGNGLGTSGTHQPNWSAGPWRDALLVKFNSSGQRLWATYYGDTSSDYAYTVFADSGGVYIGGATSSDAGIATPGSFQQVKIYVVAGFIAKFNSSGTRQWGSYYPGHILSITGFADSIIYIGGSPTVSAAAATTGAHQTTPGGNGDAFIGRLNTAGVRSWGTLYGGSGIDQIFSVTVDPAGYVYAAGETGSSTNIATPGSFQPTMSGIIDDGFIVKFSPSGIRQWGTYCFGNNGSIIGNLITDSSGYLYIAGFTYATSGVATAGAYQSANAGSADAFLSIFSSNGARQWGTYYGSSGVEQNWGIAFGANKVYICGQTNSTSGMTTTGAHQTSYGGSTFDAYLAQFRPDVHVYMKDIGGITHLCTGDSLLVRYGTTGVFNSSNVFSVQLSNATGSFASPTILGTKTGTQADSLKVLIPASLSNGSGYRIRMVASSPADTTLDLGVDITVAISPAKPVATSNSPLCAGDSLKLTANNITGVIWSWTGPNTFTDNIQNTGIANVTTAATGDYIVTVTNNGCVRKDTVSVTVGAMPAKPVAGNNSPICAGAILNLTANTTTPGVTWAWYGPNGFTSTQQNPTINPAALADSGNYVVTVSLNGCTRSDTTHAEISNVSSIGAYASPNDTFCEGTLATFVAVPFNMGSNPQYQWFKNGNPISGATNTLYNTSSYATGDSFYCRMIATGVCSTPLTLFTQGIKITVLPITLQPSITISSVPAQPIPGQPVAFTATSVNGGPNPSYQWRRNGQDMTGAIYANWSASNLAPYDKITCIVFSSDVCATPKTDTSNPIVVNFPTGVKDIDNDGVMLYPNPNGGEFTLDIPLVPLEGGIDLQVVNAMGQLAYRENVKSQILNSKFQNRIVVSLPATIANGVYLLKLEAGGQYFIQRFTVER